ncbi:hypothetical protein Gotur_019722 [Gossypium turneri]
MKVGSIQPAEEFPPEKKQTPDCTELANAYFPDTVIASSPKKEVHNPWAFYLHAALLSQAFTHCGKFPTTASRKSLGRVSVPVWLIIALVSYCLTN